MIATAYVRGLQSQGIAACPKHFLANEMENGRRWCDSVVDERALREIYLEPFRMVVKEGDPWTLMTAYVVFPRYKFTSNMCFSYSYNSLNGAFCSESSSLLSILREEWRFSGVIVSDWFGTYSTVSAINAGLDLEMPGPTKFRDLSSIRAAIERKQVCSEQLTDSAQRVHRLLQKTGRVKTPGITHLELNVKPQYQDCLQTRDLLRKACQNTMVLLKNDFSSLPLPEHTKGLVVVGEHAKNPTLFGGGSASLHVPDVQSPWNAIARQFPDATYVAGVGTERLVKTFPSKQFAGCNINLDWYNGSNPTTENRFLSQSIPEAVYMLVEDAPEGLLDRSDFCTIMSFDIVPRNTNKYLLSICSPGTVSCSMNGNTVLAMKRDLSVSTEDFLFDRSRLECCSEPITLKAGKNYKFKITSWSSKHRPENVNREFFIQGCRIGLDIVTDDEKALCEAEAKVESSQTAIIFAGTGPEWESEGFDRVNMELPRRQNDMITRVADACSGRKIVVLNTGSPVDMSSWIHKVDVVIQAWFPGLEFGEGLLDLLIGRCSPCARLPTTFWDKVEDYPSGNAGKLVTPDKKVFYNEGIFLGYRNPSDSPSRPRYSFGHGLSYSDFTYTIHGSRIISVDEMDCDESIDIAVIVKNTGNYSAQESVLLFVQPPDSQSIPRPTAELKAFTKTTLLKPHEHSTVHFLLQRRSFAYWDTSRHAWYVKAGSYRVVFAGPNGVGDWKSTAVVTINITSSWSWDDAA